MTRRALAPGLLRWRDELGTDWTRRRTEADALRVAGVELGVPRDPGWPEALAQLCERGRPDRAELLAGCRRRMRAGPHPGRVIRYT